MELNLIFSGLGPGDHNPWSEIYTIIVSVCIHPDVVNSIVFQQRSQSRSLDTM